MRTIHNPIYQLLNRDYFESFECYLPQLADFHEMVSSKLPSGWEIKRRGIWFSCSSSRTVLPQQGWKIHLSASRANAREILDRISSILFAADVAFKFALDVPTLFLLNGKAWPRGASGKFITVYPPDSRRFLEVVEELYQATKGLQGPYILSDHRYKDSHVVFYRYGGMRLREALDVTGERTPMLVAPDGSEYPDRRLPYPETPAWAEPVIPIEPCLDADEPYILGGGQFRIDGVISFSSAGGVYEGTEIKSGVKVIVKEARPCIEVSAGIDAVTLLKKEHRLLSLLASTAIAPRPRDFFQEGTHWFLVEEQIQGRSLAAYSASQNILLRTRPTEDDFQTWYQTLRRFSCRLLEILEILEKNNVVFADLSPNNVIVTVDGNDLKLIDFEGAYQVGVDQPTTLFTPGFVSQKRLQGGVAGFEDDYYSIGAVLMAFLLPVTNLFHLKPQALEEFLLAIQKDARLPSAMVELIQALMKPDARSQVRREKIAALLPETCSQAQPAEKPQHDYAAVLDGITQHLLQVATYDRPDRLFPADPKLFATNPLSLAYGAAGIAYAIKKITGSVPRQIVDWILDRRVHAGSYAPGLYLGMSGVAWTLLEIGERPSAEKLFQLSFGHHLLDSSPDLFYGSSGWGMTCLRFFLETRNGTYLQKALGCGERLLENISTNASADHNRGLGLAHGASGIALFLLYLHLVSGEERFLITGKKALEMDLAGATRTTDGGLSWGPSANSRSIVYPYWRHGSAGVGSVVVRYQKVLGGNSYREVLEKIFIDTDRKYAVLPGRFAGLAGIADFLLDAWTFAGDEKYLSSAHRAAQGIMRFAVNRGGIAFPGSSLNRLSCDYGTGSAGIALFLNRLLGRQTSDFLLDDLFGLNEAPVSGPARVGMVKHSSRPIA